MSSRPVLAASWRWRSPPCPRFAPSAAQSDLDAFMGRVLARRDENWKKLQQYILDEEERLQLIGPDGSRLYGFDRDYTWFIRRGVFHPQSAQGRRRHASARPSAPRPNGDWIEREKRARAARRRSAPQARAAGGATVAGDAQRQAVDAPQRRSTTCCSSRSSRGSCRRRISSASSSTPGTTRSPAASSSTVATCCAIEYYPSKLFTEGRTKPDKRVRDKDDEIEEKMNKVSLVTLWIDPNEHQISSTPSTTSTWTSCPAARSSASTS